MVLRLKSVVYACVCYSHQVRLWWHENCQRLGHVQSGTDARIQETAHFCTLSTVRLLHLLQWIWMQFGWFLFTFFISSVIDVLLTSVSCISMHWPSYWDYCLLESVFDDSIEVLCETLVWSWELTFTAVLFSVVYLCASTEWKMMCSGKIVLAMKLVFLASHPLRRAA